MIRIGCVQYNPIFGDVDSNLDKIEKIVSDAKADLLVFPELALTGYFFTSSSEASRYAQPLDGAAIERIRKIAQGNNVAIVTGFLESDSGILYNSAIAIDRLGNVAGHYRKVHLFYYEKVLFAAGDLGFPVFEIEVGNGEKIRLGMEICYDWRFPEATRSLALQGAEVIAMPSNIVTTTGMLLETLKVRAFENKVILAFADRVGSESAQIDGKVEDLVFRGQSCIINFNGDILSIEPSQGESISYAEVEPAGSRLKTINKFNNIITDRINKMYFT
ncbi:MAG: nitrilase-related carbon-nitrogen hydrolase [Bacteroidota bacterium]|nr:nitrilase-related carbon-nitrogen hydrolase [Bacteroidota bacterium]MDP4229329.1 nitrilase-related carbon-nitrogen hydrolase [Bacteroidota bacterium]MDP4236913.1 nitrilase-related carbon-nitrogen hydrolase [Bacteroidota bacterium]